MSATALHNGVDRKDRIPSPSESFRGNVVDHDAANGMCSSYPQTLTSLSESRYREVTDDLPAVPKRSHTDGKNHMIVVQPLKRSEMQVGDYHLIPKRFTQSRSSSPHMLRISGQERCV
jgi:hypothetical protein